MSGYFAECHGPVNFEYGLGFFVRELAFWHLIFQNLFHMYAYKSCGAKSSTLNGKTKLIALMTWEKKQSFLHFILVLCIKDLCDSIKYEEKVLSDRVSCV